MNFSSFNVPYAVDEQYSKRIAYFSMEFAVHQPLKIYSGGLGFLSGSHMRSAYELRQNLVGIGILWKYGYYDQARNQDQTLQVQWNEKIYNFTVCMMLMWLLKLPNLFCWVLVALS
jgi:glycogen phosphorylase